MTGITCLWASDWLHMNEIDVIGFDFDDSLITYTPQKQLLVLDLAKEVLDKVTGLDLGDMDEDDLKRYSHLSRGTIIDRENGHFLHVNTNGRINNMYLGTKPISRDKWGKVSNRYKRNHIDFTDPNFLWIDSIDRVIDGILLARLVESTDEKDLSRYFAKKHYEELVGPTDQYTKRSVLDPKKYNYGFAAGLVRACLDKVHRDDSMKGEILLSLKKGDSQYIDDPSYIPNLVKHFGANQRGKNKDPHTKKFTIITNSEPEYVNPVMDHYFGDSWKKWFVNNVSLAGKPHYFRVRDNQTDYQLWKTLDAFNLEHPSQLLYVGDNIYSDIVKARDLQVQTCAIVHELGEDTCRQIMDRCPKFRANVEKSHLYAERVEDLLFLDRDQILSPLVPQMRHEMVPHPKTHLQNT